MEGDAASSELSDACVQMLHSIEEDDAESAGMLDLAAACSDGDDAMLDDLESSLTPRQDDGDLTDDYGRCGDGGPAGDDAPISLDGGGRDWIVQLWFAAVVLALVLL